MKHRKAIAPAYWQKYLQSFPEDPISDALIENARFTVIDVEATGLDAKEDRILSIGAVRVEANRIDVSSALEVFVSQSRSSRETIPIHGIMRNGAEDKVDEGEAVEMLLAYVANSILVGHRVLFDRAILNRTVKRHAGGKLRNRIVDTAKLYRRIEGNSGMHAADTSLDHLCDRFEIPSSDRHTAAGDAFMTAMLLLKLIAQLKRRGIRRVNELLRFRNQLI